MSDSAGGGRGNCRHQAWLPRNIDATAQLVGGLAFLLLFLLHSSLLLRSLQMVFFLFCIPASGKRVRFALLLPMAFAAVAFQLLQPAGEVLFRWGRFALTDGALHEGLFRAVTITGMIAVSIFSVRPGIRIPGQAGKMIGQLLLYFEQIIEYRRQLAHEQLFASQHGFVHKLDMVLFSVFPPDAAEIPVQEPFQQKTSLAGYLFLLAFLGIDALLVVKLLISG